MTPDSILKLKYKGWLGRLVGAALRKRSSKKWINFVKTAFFLVTLPIELIGDLLFSYKRFGRKGPPKEIRKILISKIDQLGDVTFSTLLLSYLKNKFPNAEIHYLINEKAKGVLEKNPNINKLFFYSYFSLGYIIGRSQDKNLFRNIKNNFIVARNTFRELKKEKYDIIINARAHPPTINWYLWLLRPKFLVAFDVSIFSFLADYMANYSLYAREDDNFLNLLTPFRIDRTRRYRLEFFNFAEESAVYEKLLKIGVNLRSDKFAVISPISFDKEKCWTEAGWKKVAEFLQEKNLTVLLVGLKEQNDYLERIKNKTEGSRVKIVNNFSFSEVAFLIKTSQLLLTIESAPVFIGVACNTPTIVFVNTEFAYVPGISKKGRGVDGRTLLPLRGSLIAVYPTTAMADEVINTIGRVLS